MSDSDLATGQLAFGRTLVWHGCGKNAGDLGRNLDAYSNQVTTPLGVRMSILRNKSECPRHELLQGL